MAIAQNIQTGGSTAGQANVDANFNLNVVLPQAIAQAGSAVPIRLALSQGASFGRAVSIN